MNRQSKLASWQQLRADADKSDGLILTNNGVKITVDPVVELKPEPVVETISEPLVENVIEDASAQPEIKKIKKIKKEQ